MKNSIKNLFSITILASFLAFFCSTDLDASIRKKLDKRRGVSILKDNGKKKKTLSSWLRSTYFDGQPLSDQEVSFALDFIEKNFNNENNADFVKEYLWTLIGFAKQGYLKDRNIKNLLDVSIGLINKDLKREESIFRINTNSIDDYVNKSAIEFITELLKQGIFIAEEEINLIADKILELAKKSSHVFYHYKEVLKFFTEYVKRDYSLDKVNDVIKFFIDSDILMTQKIWFKLLIELALKDKVSDVILDNCYNIIKDGLDGEDLKDSTEKLINEFQILIEEKIKKLNKEKDANKENLEFVEKVERQKNSLEALMKNLSLKN